jgi:hypothetical protein
MVELRPIRGPTGFEPTITRGWPHIAEECADLAYFARKGGLRRKSWFSGHQSVEGPEKISSGICVAALFVGLYRLVPRIVDTLTIVRPETVVRWHRAGFGSFWQLEIQTARRETERPAGDPLADPGHEPGQPALGRPPHSQRTAQARHRHRPNERCEVHGSEEGRAVTGLGGPSLQSRRRHRLDGPFRCADTFFPSAVWRPESCGAVEVESFGWA